MQQGHCQPLSLHRKTRNPMNLQLAQFCDLEPNSCKYQSQLIPGNQFSFRSTKVARFYHTKRLSTEDRNAGNDISEIHNVFRVSVAPTRAKPFIFLLAIRTK